MSELLTEIRADLRGHNSDKNRCRINCRVRCAIATRTNCYVRDCVGNEPMEDDDGLLPYVAPYTWGKYVIIVASLVGAVYSVKQMTPKPVKAAPIPILSVNVPGTDKMCPLVRIHYDGNWSCK